MLWFILACGGEEPVEVPEPLPVEPTPEAEMRYTQTRLASDPSAITITGELLCNDAAAPWTLRVWSLRRADRDRAPDALPTGAVLTEMLLEAPGPFSIRSTRSARLLMVGLSADTPPRIAWGDAHGRYTEAVQDLEGLNLSCDIHPTPSPDGSELASQGVPVIEEPPPVMLEGENAEAQWLAELPVAPKVNVHRRKPSEIGGSETLDRIQDRYKSQLSEEELLLHIPMLYQLADNPKDADEYVRGIVSSRGR